MIPFVENLVKLAAFIAFEPSDQPEAMAIVVQAKTMLETIEDFCSTCILYTWVQQAQQVEVRVKKQAQGQVMAASLAMLVPVISELVEPTTTAATAIISIMYFTNGSIAPEQVSNPYSTELD